MNQIGSAMGHSYSGEAAAIPTSQIESAFHDLAGNIEGLHDALGNLECRIESVLIPSAPVGEAKADGPKPVAIESQVLYSINALKQRVIDAQGRIASMLNRAQV